MDFTDFLGDDDLLVQEAARILEEARAGLKDGVLTREQFDEIAEDVLQVEQIDELADDLERKIRIEQAFDALKVIISAIPK